MASIGRATRCRQFDDNVRGRGRLAGPPRSHEGIGTYNWRRRAAREPRRFAKTKPEESGRFPIDSANTRRLLEQVAAGRLSPEEAAGQLARVGTEDLGYALLDHERTARKGFSEVVYGGGKTPEQVARIAERVFNASGVVLVTRTGGEAFALIRERVPEARYNELGRLVWADRRPRKALIPGVLVAAAGTSDLPVAEEAAITARLMGCEVERLNDVGVAGLHRLADRLHLLRSARVIVAVAGMEGALPSVIGGLVAVPVIAVPTSVGYGASFSGLTALLAMLNSCAAGVAVVNIDNGFGGGYLAAIIARGAGEKAPEADASA